MALKIFLVFLFISIAQPQKPCKSHQFYNSIKQRCIVKYTLYTDCTTNDQCYSELCIDGTCVCETSIYQ